MLFHAKFDNKKIDGPVFLKEFDADNNQNIKKLNELLELVGDDQKPLIEEQIKYMTIGMAGEKNVYYELQHSYLPLLCLHDIRLEYRGLTSQFDFILIFRHFIMVLETKKLIGDIMIDSEGNFTRVFKDFKGNIFKKEGMYSPISQNQKHVDLLERMLLDNKIIKKLPIFSLVVVANPKTIISKQYAPEEVKKCIIKYDQLKNEFTKLIEENSKYYLSDKEMYDIANFLMKHDQPLEYDYVKMLNLKIEKKPEAEKKLEKRDEIIITDNNSEADFNDELYEKLKNYRLEQAKKRNITELYFIYNNKTLEQIVLEQPTTKEQLLKISGFGERKWEDYGEDIIEIVKSFQLVHKDDAITKSSDELPSTPLVKELRKFRFQKAEEENIKPYLIYNNKEILGLIEAMPKTKEELLQVKGFGETKVAKYGDDILVILDKHRN